VAGYDDLMMDPTAAAADPQAAQAQLVKNQWQLFVDRYRPFEDETINFLNRDIEPEVQQAGQATGRQFDIGLQSMARDARRYGLDTNSDTARSIARQQGLSKALGVAGAQNNMRRNWEETKTQGLADLISIGKGISGQASSSLSSAADMAASRNLAYQNNKAAAGANQMSALSSLAGLAMAAYFM